MKNLFKKHPAVSVIGVTAILVTAVLVIIKLANPANPVDPEPETQTTVGTAAQDITKRTSQANTKPSADEPTLRKLLQSRIDEEDEILSFDYLDYDGDGGNEAFAFVGKETGDTEGGPPYLGELWFVDADGAEMMVSREETNGYYDISRIYTFGTHAVVTLSKFYQTGDLALVWAVKDGKPYEETGISSKGGTFARLDANDFAMWHDTYDLSFDGTGHTYKWYWFYWDEQSASFKEYGGRVIEYGQFLKCKGAQAVLDAIDAADCAVREIFYRDNGIININYVDYEDETNHNATLRLKGDTVTLQAAQAGVAGEATDSLEDSDQGGVYAKALLPDIAAYPSKLPAVFG